MLIDRITRAIDLVKKTGDKMILFEEDNSEGIVVMSLKEYERMIDGNKVEVGQNGEDPESISSLTEDELIDKINRNIAIWQNENKDKELDSEKIIDSFLGLSEEFEEMEEDEEEGEDNFYYYNEEDKIFHPEEEISPQELKKIEEEAQAEAEEETRKEEKEEKEEGDGQDEIGETRSNWEIPVNIKRNAEEVEE